MPKLLPPSEGDPILGDVINEMDGTTDLLQETGRQNVLDFEDATKIVSALSLALGIIFLVTTASLYAYYYSTTFDPINRRKKRSLQELQEEEERREEMKPENFLPIILRIENAFRKWNILEEECQKKIICEAFQQQTPSHKSLLRKQKIIQRLLNSIKWVVSAMKSRAGSEEGNRYKELVKASKIGKAKGKCGDDFRGCSTSKLDLFSSVRQTHFKKSKHQT